MLKKSLAEINGAELRDHVIVTGANRIGLAQSLSLLRCQEDPGISFAAVLRKVRVIPYRLLVRHHRMKTRAEHEMCCGHRKCLGAVSQHLQTMTVESFPLRAEEIHEDEIILSGQVTAWTDKCHLDHMHLSDPCAEYPVIPCSNPTTAIVRRRMGVQTDHTSPYPLSTTELKPSNVEKNKNSIGSSIIKHK